MSEQTPIDEPAPTIVGPRPARGQTIPRGIEQLLTLAGLSAEWRGKVLADPLAAAAEAGIELSESERAILKSTPRGSLEQTADSLARSHGRPVMGGAAAQVAAAALLATGLSGCGDGCSPATEGIRPDIPSSKPAEPPPERVTQGARPNVPPEAPPVQWLASLDEALAEAKKSNRAVLAVFPIPPEKLPAPDPNRGISVEEASQMVCSSDSKEFRLAVKGANVLAVKVVKPVVPFGGAEWSREQWDKHNENVKAYEAALRKYGLDGDGKLPAVVFLAPNGSELSRLARPTEEAKLIEAVKAVPPQLAKWIADQRKPEPPAPPPSAGTRPPPPDDWK